MGLGPHGGGAIGWWSPDPRGVIPAGALRVQPLAAQGAATASRCGSTPPSTRWSRRCADPSREGRWITREIAAAYGRAPRARLGAQRRGLAGRRARRRPLRRVDRRPVRGGVDVPRGARRLEGRPRRARRARSTPTATRAGSSTCSGPPTTCAASGRRSGRARSTSTGSPRPCARLRSTCRPDRGRCRGAEHHAVARPAVVLVVQRHACAPSSGPRPARPTRPRRRRRAAPRSRRPGRSRAARASRMTGTGHRVPRASTTGDPPRRPAAVGSGCRGLGLRLTGRPSRARRRTVATASGSSRHSRSTSAARSGETAAQGQRDPHVAVGQHPHRGEHVARAAARSTCRPSRTRRARPRRASSSSSTSPSA